MNLPLLILVAKYDSADDQAKELISALKAAHAVDTTTIQGRPITHFSIIALGWRAPLSRGSTHTRRSLLN
jgi:hypothetical protein